MNVHYMMSIVATIMAITLPTIAQTKEFGDADKGRDFAARICANCHAVDAENTASPKPEAPSFKAVADRPKTTRMALTVWLRSTHPTMPNLILSTEDKNNVIAYILSLKDRP